MCAPQLFLLSTAVLASAGALELPIEPLGAGCDFERLATRPRLFRCRGFASQAWLQLLAAESEAWLAASQVCGVRRTCRSFVTDLGDSPALSALTESLFALLSPEAASEARRGYLEQPLNVLRYDVGGDTNWHVDPQGQHPKDLIASAILYVGEPDLRGGETAFRKSEPEPVVVPATAGDLAVFVSCGGAGDDDPLSEHTGAKVLAGRKLVVEKFFSLPRWFCAEGFKFSAPDRVVKVAETLETARALHAGASAAPRPETGTCEACLGKGEDYCATWDTCIPRAQRACTRADHVTGSEDFAAGGFSMSCPKQDQLSLGTKFLEMKAREQGVIARESGLMYRVLRSGQGASHPSLSKLCRYHYLLQLADGTEVQSSFREGTPMVGTLEGSIAGFAEAVQLMVPGDMWTLYVPAQLGYGASGMGSIPGNAALIFMVELLEVDVARMDL